MHIQMYTSPYIGLSTYTHKINPVQTPVHLQHCVTPAPGCPRVTPSQSRRGRDLTALDRTADRALRPGPGTGTVPGGSRPPAPALSTCICHRCGNLNFSSRTKCNGTLEGEVRHSNSFTDISCCGFVNVLEIDSQAVAIPLLKAM